MVNKDKGKLVLLEERFYKLFDNINFSKWARQKILEDLESGKLKFPEENEKETKIEENDDVEFTE